MEKAFQGHSVQKLSIELSFKKGDARYQSAVQDIATLREEIYGLIEENFSQYIPEDKIIQVNKVSFNLGTLPYKDYLQIFKERLKILLQAELQKLTHPDNVNVLPENKGIIKDPFLLLEEFLINGFHPFLQNDQYFELESFIKGLTSKDPDRISTILYGLSKSSHVKKRIQKAFSNNLKQFLLNLPDIHHSLFNKEIGNEEIFEVFFTFYLEGLMKEGHFFIKPSDMEKLTMYLLSVDEKRLKQFFRENIRNINLQQRLLNTLSYQTITNIFKNAESSRLNQQEWSLWEGIFNKLGFFNKYVLKNAYLAYINLSYGAYSNKIKLITSVLKYHHGFGHTDFAITTASLMSYYKPDEQGFSPNFTRLFNGLIKAHQQQNGLSEIEKTAPVKPSRQTDHVWGLIYYFLHGIWTNTDKDINELILGLPPNAAQAFYMKLFKEWKNPHLKYRLAYKMPMEHLYLLTVKLFGANVSYAFFQDLLFQAEKYKKSSPLPEELLQRHLYFLYFEFLSLSFEHQWSKLYFNDWFFNGLKDLVPSHFDVRDLFSEGFQTFLNGHQKYDSQNLKPVLLRWKEDVSGMAGHKDEIRWLFTLLLSDESAFLDLLDENDFPQEFWAELIHILSPYQVDHLLGIMTPFQYDYVGELIHELKGFVQFLKFGPDTLLTSYPALFYALQKSHFSIGKREIALLLFKSFFNNDARISSMRAFMYSRKENGFLKDDFPILCELFDSIPEEVSNKLWADKLAVEEVYSDMIYQQKADMLMYIVQNERIPWWSALWQKKNVDFEEEIKRLSEVLLVQGGLKLWKTFKEVSNEEAFVNKVVAHISYKDYMQVIQYEAPNIYGFVMKFFDLIAGTRGISPMFEKVHSSKLLYPLVLRYILGHKNGFSASQFIQHIFLSISKELKTDRGNLLQYLYNFTVKKGSLGDKQFDIFKTLLEQSEGETYQDKSIDKQEIIYFVKEGQLKIDKRNVKEVVQYFLKYRSLPSSYSSVSEEHFYNYWKEWAVRNPTDYQETLKTFLTTTLFLQAFQERKDWKLVDFMITMVPKDTQIMEQINILEKAFSKHATIGNPEINGFYLKLAALQVYGTKGRSGLDDGAEYFNSWWSLVKQDLSANYLTIPPIDATRKLYSPDHRDEYGLYHYVFGQVPGFKESNLFIEKFCKKWEQRFLSSQSFNLDEVSPKPQEPFAQWVKGTEKKYQGNHIKLFLSIWKQCGKEERFAEEGIKYFEKALVQALKLDLNNEELSVSNRYAIFLIWKEHVFKEPAWTISFLKKIFDNRVQVKKFLRNADSLLLDVLFDLPCFTEDLVSEEIKAYENYMIKALPEIGEFQIIKGIRLGILSVYITQGLHGKNVPEALSDFIIRFLNQEGHSFYHHYSYDNGNESNKYIKWQINAFRSTDSKLQTFITESETQGKYNLKKRPERSFNLKDLRNKETAVSTNKWGSLTSTSSIKHEYTELYNDADFLQYYLNTGKFPVWSHINQIGALQGFMNGLMGNTESQDILKMFQTVQGDLTRMKRLKEVLRKEDFEGLENSSGIQVQQDSQNFSTYQPEAIQSVDLLLHLLIHKELPWWYYQNIESKVAFYKTIAPEMRDKKDVRQAYFDVEGLKKKVLNQHLQFFAETIKGKEYEEGTIDHLFRGISLQDFIRLVNARFPGYSGFVVTFFSALKLAIKELKDFQYNEVFHHKNYLISYQYLLHTNSFSAKIFTATMIVSIAPDDLRKNKITGLLSKVSEEKIRSGEIRFGILKEILDNGKAFDPAQIEGILYKTGSDEEEGQVSSGQSKDSVQGQGTTEFIFIFAHYIKYGSFPFSGTEPMWSKGDFLGEINMNLQNNRDSLAAILKGLFSVPAIMEAFLKRKDEVFSYKILEILDEDHHTEYKRWVQNLDKILHTIHGRIDKGYTSFTSFQVLFMLLQNKNRASISLYGFLQIVLDRSIKDGFIVPSFETLEKIKQYPTTDESTFLIRKSLENMIASKLETERKDFFNAMSHSLKEDKEEVVPEVRIKGALKIKNAGIILAAPFLNHYFSRLDMLTTPVLENGKLSKPSFKTEIMAKRGAQLIQYLASGSTEMHEHELVLNKILSGLKLNLPLEPYFEITDLEKEMSESFLKGMLKNWGKIKTESIEALREGFLMREGYLEETDIGWHLEVERKALDVLVDLIPWPYKTIKLSWMEKSLNTTWGKEMI